MIDDEIPFAAEDDPAPPSGIQDVDPWKVLVVDDEAEVHAVTRMVLAGTGFRERPLELLGAYSAEEARAILDRTSDVAVILLDVVMEEDQAGLELVRHVRETMGNRLVRIILRTGQPGQAPERDVIIQYDIDDYKEKSELTSQKLTTSVITALRSYQDLATIDAGRRGLARIVDASARLSPIHGLDDFLRETLRQFPAIVDHWGHALVCLRDRRKPDLSRPRVVAADDRFGEAVGQSVDRLASRATASAILDAFERRGNLYADAWACLFLAGENAHEAVVYVECDRPFGELDRALIDTFSAGAATGLDNTYLYDQLRLSEQATVYALAKLAEFKDDKTGSHVRRVQSYSTEVARVLRGTRKFPEIVDDAFVDMIGLASVLHDVGKVGVPDAVLKKPAHLDAGEWDVMRRHPAISREILEEAARMVDGVTYLSMGAEIAGAHHERYDGEGYPNRLAGEQIPLAARILAVVDVFDALTSRRPYKEAWPREKALAFLKEQSGRHFDPVVIDAFLEAVDRGSIPGPPP